jgi:hypothetical protein
MITRLRYLTSCNDPRRFGFHRECIIGQAWSSASKLDNLAWQQTNYRCSGKLSTPGGAHPVNPENQVEWQSCGRAIDDQITYGCFVFRRYNADDRCESSLVVNVQYEHEDAF